MSRQTSMRDNGTTPRVSRSAKSPIFANLSSQPLQVMTPTTVGTENKIIMATLVVCCLALLGAFGAQIAAGIINMSSKNNPPILFADSQCKDTDSADVVVDIASIYPLDKYLASFGSSTSQLKNFDPFTAGTARCQDTTKYVALKDQCYIDVYGPVGYLYSSAVSSCAPTDKRCRVMERFAYPIKTTSSSDIQYAVGGWGYLCKNGCVSGACVKDPAPICTDSDLSSTTFPYISKNSSPYIKGVTTGLMGGFSTTTYDVCYGPSELNQLIEYYCSNGQVTNTGITCDNGCIDGACIQSTKVWNFSLLLKDQKENVETKTSLDGKYSIIYSMDKLYISNDYAKTWNPIMVKGVYQWLNIAMSDDGKNLVALVRESASSKDNLMVSIDYGKTWNYKIKDIVGAYGLSMSQDGRCIISTNQTDKKQVMYSLDYGNSFKYASTTFKGVVMESVHVLPDCSEAYIIENDKPATAVPYVTSYYKSNDFSNWTFTRSFGSIRVDALKVSSDSKYHLAVGRAYADSSKPNSFSLLLSTTGARGGFNTIKSNQGIRDIDMSKNGQKILFADWQYVYSSDDFGKNWLNFPSFKQSGIINDISISGDGKFVLASVKSTSTGEVIIYSYRQ